MLSYPYILHFLPSSFLACCRLQVQSNFQGSMAAFRSTTTTEVTFDDAPPKPEVLTLTLKDKTLWARYYEAVRDLQPEKLLKYFNTEKQRIMAKVKERGRITEDEAQLLNKMTEDNVKKVLKEFQERVLKEMEIKVTDEPAQIELKLSFSEKLVQWLESLLEWLLEKVKQIFSMIKEAIQWCWQKTKELFDFLWSLFKN